MTDFLLYVAIPGATLIIGAIFGAWATRGIDRGVVATIDDRPFLADWERELLDGGQPFSAGDETDIVQAIRLSDGRPTANAVVALSPEQIARVVAIAQHREDRRR